MSHQDDGIKHYSGTVHYHLNFTLSEEDIANKQPIYLNLGEVQQIAEVSVNGQKLATLWKPPFAVDISRAVQAGDNKLQVDVTNTWVNRLIGDEALPDNSGYKMTGDTVPWINNDEPPPASKRVTFTGFNFFKKKDSHILQTSGPLGPVSLVKR
jgi:hypothetical protein